jgi:phosphoribosylformylglycinamidine cyclo-ligase
MTRRITYRDAGVNIEAADAALRKVRDAVASTHRPEVLGHIGGYGGLFRLPSGYTNPVLVAASDGVGTKVLVAAAADMHSTVGVDLVAMTVNDLIVQGAEPLFFLDYVAMGRLEERVLEELIVGMAEGCRQAGCALLGGETAEMPGLYEPGHYDLAGTAVGIVEESQLISGESVREGNVILGLPSTGLHSNGFSLVRRVLLHEDMPSALESTDELGYPLAEELLKPTAIYVKAVQALIEATTVNGLVHITGGGFMENIPRVIPDKCKAIIQTNSWSRPKIFDLIQERAGLDKVEMYRTFNMGLGMLAIMPEDSFAEAQKALSEGGIAAPVVGMIEARRASEPAVILLEQA